MASTPTVITTITDSGKNITTRLLIGTYTSTGTTWVTMQPRLSNLNGATALITIEVDHTLANDTVLAIGTKSKTKQNTTDTTFGFLEPIFGVLLLTGEKLKIYATSTNASDTSVTVSIPIIDIASASVADIQTQLQAAGSHLTKIKAAVYDSTVVNGAGQATLSDNAAVVWSATGSRTTTP